MLQNTQEMIKNNTQELIKNTVPALTDKQEIQIVGSDSRIKTLKEFYPFYLSQHAEPICRRLHFVGTT